PGDDPRWAAPNFDDRQWALVSSTGDWEDIGYRHLNGAAWYRFHLTLPPGDERYSLYLPVIYTSYQVYVNGTLLLTQGQLPPHASTFRSRPTVVDLPLAGPRTEPETLTIALRIWHDPLWSRYRHGGLQGLAEVGRSDLIHEHFDTQEQAHLWQYSDDVDLGALELLAAAVALVLFLTRQSEREFLWFSLLMFAEGGNHVVTAWTHLHASRVLPTDSLASVLATLFLVSALMFFRILFGGKWSNAFVFALACCGLGAMISPLSWMGTLTVAQANFASLLLELPVLGWIVLFVRKQARRKHTDARILRGPVVFLVFAFLYTSLRWALETAGLIWLSTFSVRWQKPFYFTLNDIAEVIFLAAMLVILLRRFAMRSREQDRVHSELEAARSVQQVLVPETLPSIPGLLIDTAYHPAQEVGGDFFQILPMPDGKTLIIIGDVAGKGLPAALQVSLVVGTLRALVERTDAPAEILAGLNRSLQGRGPGFTTCLVLCLAADRKEMLFSNAGHIAPYVNGFELRTEPNLPLGVVPEIVFDEARYALQQGDHLAVLTDGVPEAMHHRELFGFERTGQISRQTADSIAEAARRFGQTDDITVLTIDIVPVPATYTEQLPEPALQPA
ncbi:MAG: hypothetical protein LQ352_005823, partial [Teloschistes flavicans]